jgi:hypothetical protein
LAANRNGQPWTREDLERLRQLAADRRSVNAIAEILGRTPVGIKSKAIAMGLKLGALPRETGELAGRDVQG